MLRQSINKRLKSLCNVRFNSSKQFEQVIGIDLGTTNSAVAIMEGQTPKIIENSQGMRTTPSIVAFNKDEILVGELAKRQAIVNYSNTFYATKRLIGRRFNDTEVQKDIGNVPYRIIQHKNDDAWLQTSDGAQYSPSHIGGLVLREMKHILEQHLGTKISNAVVTVPAYFNDSQRQATKQSGQLVGLNILRVINEPTAASLLYGLDKKKDGIILVYDLGGGTFDISILDIEDGVFEVRATNGDTHLGGEDFDLLLLDYILKDFKSKTGVDLSEDRLAIQRIRQAAEKAKIELSHVKETTIELPFITKDQNISLSLTEDQLDSMSMHLIEKTIGPVKKALKDAELNTEDIDEIIMVGGMTRMPKIIETVGNLFGKKPSNAVNPDEAVALGALIQGAVLSGEVKDVLLLDVTPLTLGIETFGGIFSPLIPRNTTIPCNIKQMYSTAVDGQNSIDINVYQGERSLVQDNQLIGNFKLTDIKALPKGEPKIEVSFNIDADGIIKVKALDKETGKESSITVFGSTGLTKTEIESLVSESAKHSKEDEHRKLLFQRLNNLELICFDSEQAIQQWSLFIEDSDKEALQAFVKDIKELIEYSRQGKFDDVKILTMAQEDLKNRTLETIQKAADKSRAAKK